VNRNTFREKIQFYLIDCKTLPGKIIDIFIIMLNLLVCVIFVIETYSSSEERIALLWSIELITIVFFIIEYIARLYGSRDRLKHFLNIYSMIDLLAILPTVTLYILPVIGVSIGFIRIIRVFKVLRIFRFLRFLADEYFFFGNITKHFLKVIRLLVTILMIFFISSGFFWHFESAVNDNVRNFGDAFYFTVVALTTVGFGDIAPITEGGRWVTVLMILSGIVLIPWQASQLVKEWIRLSEKKMIICPKCGLKYHDKDASHCKSCGHIIYQEYDGD
jgi:voltage-gated potassium channel